MNIKFIPNSNKNNKYIDLLLNSLGISGADEFKKGETNIVHIHWSTNLYGSKYLLKSILLIIKNLFIYIYLKIFYDIKVVWTVHNFSAHDYPHPWIDKFGRSILFKVTDAIIVQQKSSIIFDKKCYFIPHINYTDVYGPKISRDYALKRSLGFHDTDIIFLSFGAIAPYKRNEKIIEAVEESDNVKLLIVGKGEDKYVQTIKTSKNVVVCNKFISNEDIPKYLSIADFSIFYYDESEMTSGGLILSLSYGIPVIVRNIPAAEIVDKNCGYVFKDDIELKKIIKTLENDKSKQFNTINSVIHNNPEFISINLRKIYESFN